MHFGYRSRAKFLEFLLDTENTSLLYTNKMPNAYAETSKLVRREMYSTYLRCIFDRNNWDISTGDETEEYR